MDTTDLWQGCQVYSLGEKVFSISDAGTTSFYMQTIEFDSYLIPYTKSKSNG